MNSSERAHLYVAALTHPGMSGKENEDRYSVSAYRLRDNTPSLLAIVADGIGGHRAGEVAAEMAVETISSFVAESDGNQPTHTLREAMIRASQAISESASATPARKGMGTTCACIWVIGNQLYTVSAGDSRIYLIRGNNIHQLSLDHTWVQEAIAGGALDPVLARNHPNAHVIRRYLGSKHEVEPDLRLYLHSENDEQAIGNQGAQLYPGDILLLCSDGLTDLVDDVEIFSAVRRGNLEDGLDNLVDVANQRGGHDNITIVGLRVPGKARQVAFPVAKPKRNVRLACLSVGAIAIAAALIFGGVYWYLNRDAPNLQPIGSTPLFQQPTNTLPEELSPQPATTTTSSPLVTPNSIQPVSTVSPVGGSIPAATLTPWPTNTLGP